MVHKSGSHSCPECSKTFTRLEYVNRHRRLKHLGIRPWSCACGVSYARSDLLCRHKRKCPQALDQPTLPTPTHEPSIVPTSSLTNQSLHSSSSSLLDLLASNQPDLHPATRPPSYEQAIAHLPQNQVHHPILGSETLQPNSDSIASQAHHTHHQSTHFEHTNHEAYPKHLPSHHHTNPVHSYLLTADPASDPLVNLDPVVESDDVIASTHHVNQDSGTSLDIPPISHPSSQIVRYSHPTFFITEEPTSSPFYLNPNLWVLAFLCQRGQGFTIPTVGTLSKYVRKATSDMLSVIPMIHIPTLKASLISIHLGYALAVAGAATDSTDYAIAFADQSLSYKRPLVQRDFAVVTNAFDFRFELLQTLLTYQFLGVFNRLDPQRQRAVVFNDTMIQNFRDLNLAQIVRNAPDYVKLVLEGEMALELAWRSWAKYEMHKRTVFLLLMSAYQLSEAPGLMIEEANVPLPCHEEAWTATDAESWLIAMHRHTSKCTPDGRPTIGEESIPRLIDALSCLTLESFEPAMIQPSKPSEPIGSLNLLGSPSQTSHRFASNPEIRRLGTFANLVLQHCGKIAFKNPQLMGTLIRC